MYLKPVYVYDTEGRRQDFGSFKEAAINLWGSERFHHRLKRSAKTPAEDKLFINDYCCFYSSQSVSFDAITAHRPGERGRPSCPLDLYTEDGTFIRSFDTLTAASDALGINYNLIQRVLNERVSWHGLVLIPKSKSFKAPIKKSRVKKMVKATSPTGDVVVFKSISQAAITICNSRSSIQRIKTAIRGDKVINGWGQLQFVELGVKQ